MARSDKTCKNCKKKLKPCPKHKSLHCVSCSIDCSKCMDEALAKGECPKCWEPLLKCEAHEEIVVFCPRCDLLPNPRKTDKPECPTCRSRQSQYPVDSICGKCKTKRMFCAVHGKTWCKCGGERCPWCQEALNSLITEKKPPTCNKHNIPLVTIGLDDPKEFWCKMCRDEMQYSGVNKHNCGNMMAYCATHECYVCPHCDIISGCMENCGVGKLVRYEGNGNKDIQWDWQEFLVYKDERHNIYQHLLTMAKAWPNLKQAIQSYAKLSESSQPEGAEELFADSTYFEEAIRGLNMSFVNMKIDEVMEEMNADTETDIEFDDDEDNRGNRDDYDDDGRSGYYGDERYHDGSWGMPNRQSHSNQERHYKEYREYRESRNYAIRPQSEPMSVKVVEEFTSLEEGMDVFPFVAIGSETVRGEKGTIKGYHGPYAHDGFVD